MNTELAVQANFWQLLSLPLIAAGIGWLTNYIAVKMLFHPRQPIRLLVVTIQGVFPKRQAVLAEKFGQLVARELVSTEDVMSAVKRGIVSPDFVKRLAPHLDDLVNKDLPQELPMLAMFLTPELAGTIKAALMRKLEPFLDQAVDALGAGIEQDFAVEELVREKVANFSSDKLEQILLDIMRKEFKFIELVGAVLGFLIGVVQVVILLAV